MSDEAENELREIRAKMERGELDPKRARLVQRYGAEIVAAAAECGITTEDGVENFADGWWHAQEEVYDV